MSDEASEIVATGLLRADGRHLRVVACVYLVLAMLVVVLPAALA